MTATSLSQTTTSYPNSFDTNMLQPSHQVALENLCAAILRSTPAPAAILSGNSSGLIKLTTENHTAEGAFLSRVALAELKSVLGTTNNAWLVQKIAQVQQMASSFLNDTPEFKKQEENGILGAAATIEAIRVAISKELNKKVPGSAEALASVTEKFLADIRARITPPSDMAMRQADLSLTQKDLHRALVTTAADNNNPRLQAAFVAFASAQIERSAPTSPRQIAAFLGYCMFSDVEPVIGQGERAQAHRDFITTTPAKFIDILASTLAKEVVTPTLLAASQLTTKALEELRTGVPQLIGRHSKCDMVVINDGEVSAYHLLIERLENSKWAIYDKGSTNGTYVNGVKIDQKSRVVIDSGVELQIGSTKITLP